MTKKIHDGKEYLLYPEKEELETEGLHCPFCKDKVEVTTSVHEWCPDGKNEYGDSYADFEFNIYCCGIDLTVDCEDGKEKIIQMWKKIQGEA